jgi:hypothetical protein
MGELGFEASSGKKKKNCSKTHLGVTGLYGKRDSKMRAAFLPPSVLGVTTCAA